MTARTLAAAAALALSSTACGYRLVRYSDVTAKRFARDSVTITGLRNELVALQMQWHSDSLKLEGQLAAQRAAAAASLATPQADSLLKIRNAEVSALRDQLTRVTVELDRIKRRLANPRG